MSYSDGILSIRDPKGRYMGMQDVASGFLTERNIDISTQGPKEDPTAIVLEVSAKEDEFVKEEDKTYSRIKADYKKNATPSMFSMLLSRATANFDYDKDHKNGNTYRIYNNGRHKDVTPAEFYTDTCDFRLNK